MEKLMSEEEIQQIPRDISSFLFEHGAFLIVLDVPKGTDFGMDLKSWQTGERFMGMKMIPPGLHFIHYSAVNEFGEQAPRIGFFHEFKEKEIVVKKWNKISEDITTELVNNEVVLRFRHNLKDLDRYLGPYPYPMLQAWKELTTRIDGNLIERCQPLCGYVRAALELTKIEVSSRTSPATIRKRRRYRMTMEEREELLLPNLQPAPGTELRFTPMPEKYYPDDATPAEVTQHSIDTSYAFNCLLGRLRDPMEIIGELQLAFICFLVGQSFDSFDHWKNLIILICQVDKAIPERRAIFAEFLRVLEVQLIHVAEDALCDIVSNNNFVYHHLRMIFSNIEFNPAVDGRLKSEARRFLIRLTSKFSWDFDGLEDEQEDEAPVIVHDIESS